MDDIASAAAITMGSLCDSLTNPHTDIFGKYIAVSAKHRWRNSIVTSSLCVYRHNKANG